MIMYINVSYINFATSLSHLKKPPRLTVPQNGPGAAQRWANPFGASSTAAVAAGHSAVECFATATADDPLLSQPPPLALSGHLAVVTAAVIWTADRRRCWCGLCRRRERSRPRWSDPFSTATWRNRKLPPTCISGGKHVPNVSKYFKLSNFNKSTTSLCKRQINR